MNPHETAPPVQEVENNQSYSNKLKHTPNFFSGFDLKKSIISLILFILVIFIWQWVSSPMIVTVQGLGEVSVPATSASISLTVTANAGTSSASIDAVKSKTDNIRTLLIASGINESDISESQVVSYPVWSSCCWIRGFRI